MGAAVLDKTAPFSTPTKPSAKLTSSVEAKENRIVSPSFTNQMRSSTKKNFMSPTISAASKTVAQRKKILVEKNGGEATETTCAKVHRRRSSSFDLKQGSIDISASTDSLSSSINEINSVEDELDAAKMKPYDPVNNYCSPRPKFLLYKPDRRSEILRRYEMIDATSSESESSVEHEECLVKPNVEVTEDVREIVDHKEEVVAHIDEGIEGSAKEIKEKMQEPVEEVAKKSEDQHEILENIENRNEVNESFENHCKEIKEELVMDVEVVKNSNVINQQETTMLENRTGEIKIEDLEIKNGDEINNQCMEIEDDDEEGEFDEEFEVEKRWSFKSLLKLWLVIVVLGLSILYLSSMNSTSVSLNSDDWKVQSDLHRALFINENASGSVIQNELAKIVFEEASRRIKGEIIIREPDHYSDEPLEDVNGGENEGIYVKVLSEDLDAELVPMSEADNVEAVEDEIDLASEEMVTEDINVGKIEVEELINVEENITPEVIIQLDETETEFQDAATEVIEPHSEASKAAYVEMDVVADAKYQTEMTLDENVAFEDSTAGDLQVEEDQGVTDDSLGDGMLNNLEKVEEVTEVRSSPAMVDDDLLIRYSKESVKTGIVGAVSSFLFAVIGFMILQKLKRANKTSQEQAANESEQDAIRRHHVKQVDHFAYSSYSKHEADSFNNGVGAPRVQLLGEYTVGEKDVSSYSLRTDYFENYNDSSCSFPQRNLKMSASQPAMSGFSSTTGTPPYGVESSQRRSHKKEVPASSVDSPSYGSFTTEMMFRKKEEAQGEEKIIATPVRRSSRIHSRRTPGPFQ